MIEFLRRWLGMDLLLSEIDSLRQKRNELYVELKETHGHYQDLLAIKDEEIRRLTDLMLIEHGVISREPDARTTQPNKPQPIGRRASFRSMREKYEAADRKMAKDQVDVLKDYWTKKDQEASKETVS